MRPSLPAALAALALLGSACQQPPPAGRPPAPPTPPGVTGAITIRDGAGAAGPFQLSGLSTLTVDARLAGLAAGEAHALRLDVLTPRGTLYAQYRGTVEPDGAGDVAFTRVLEVSGTPIEAFQQHGAWTFVLALDEGAPLASAEASLVE